MNQTPLPQTTVSDDQSKVSSVWKKSFEKLVSPHPSVTNSQARREARLLAMMLLFIIVATVVDIPTIRAQAPFLQNFFIGLIIIEIVGYLFSRTQYYQVGLTFILVSLISSISYSASLQDEFTQYNLMAALAWVVLPIIFASIFFRPRFVLLFIAYMLVNILLLPVFNSEISYTAISPVFFFIVTVIGLILLLIRHFSQLENDRLSLMMAQQEMLTLSNQELQQQIQERFAAEKALEKAQQQLEQRVMERTAELAQTNKDLETLLYVISHDLKEPLRSVRFFSDMVSLHYAETLDEKGQDWLRRINRSGTRLQMLISDILTLSRIRQVELTLDWIDGNEVVSKAIEQLDETIRETAATIEIAPNLPQLYANLTWATQAVVNLIGNALKFRVENQPPMIEIAPHFEAGQSGIVIRDRGIGVKPESCEKIFQLFQRGVGNEFAGTGAGLAIVRQIAERHHGRAWAKPRVNSGSEFFITFANKTNDELS